MRTPPPLLLLLCAPLGGCTALILNDAQNAASPCEDVSECATGERCEGGVCVEDDRDAEPPPPPTRIDEDGGTVRGPDGLTIDFPAGAVDEAIEVSFARESGTEPPEGGATFRSRVYRVEPAIDLADAAVVTLPLPLACDDCSVHIDADGQWLPLDAAPTESGLIAGETDALGRFALVENP